MDWYYFSVSCIVFYVVFHQLLYRQFSLIILVTFNLSELILVIFTALYCRLTAAQLARGRSREPVQFRVQCNIGRGATKLFPYIFCYTEFQELRPDYSLPCYSEFSK